MLAPFYMHPPTLDKSYHIDTILSSICKDLEIKATLELGWRAGKGRSRKPEHYNALLMLYFLTKTVHLVYNIIG